MAEAEKRETTKTAKASLMTPDRLWPLLIVLGSLGCGLVLWQTAEITRRYALDQLGERNRHTLSLIAEGLRGDLARYRYLPQLLAANDRLQAALEGRLDVKERQALNEELEHVTRISGALDTYLMASDGTTLAASNWSTERPFIGQNFSYRPYFQAAMQGRLGRFFALGTTSGERGYYFAYPVRSGGDILGAVVVKIQVGHHEAAWRAKDHEVVIVDPSGVVFLSSRPEWRFRTLAPLSVEEREAIKASRRYVDETLPPLKLGPRDDAIRAGAVVAIATDADNGGKDHGLQRFLVLADDMNDADWRVLLLARTAHVDAQERVAMGVAFVVMAALALALMALYQRRRRLAERIALQAEANAELEARVRDRTRELEETRLEVIRRLGRAGEFRDNETGMHVIRMSKASQLLALRAGLGEAASELILNASPMHDVGKIGIPDNILLKPGRLTPEERTLMEQHPRIGADIVGHHPSELMQMAREIALYHHEHWSGEGYPEKLAGADIPVAARITAICDVFDALTSVRPYKAAWETAEAVAYLKDRAGVQFDPQLIDHFCDILDDILILKGRYADPAGLTWGLSDDKAS
ncbi:MAG: HD domain-containing phosphohydrolase [Rhodospirillales bacterium]